MRLLEACENADAKVDGKKPPRYANLDWPGGMRGGPGGTIGRLIKRLKFQAYIKRHFNLIKLGDLSLGVRHAVPRPQGSGGGFKRFAHSAGPVHDAWILSSPGESQNMHRLFLVSPQWSNARMHGRCGDDSLRRYLV